MIFESHAHFDDEAFDNDRDELLSSMQEKGIERIINVCAEVKNWDRTLSLMEKYPFVYGAVGVHPDDAGSLNEDAILRMHITTFAPSRVIRRAIIIPISPEPKITTFLPTITF